MKKFNSAARYGSFSLIVTAIVLVILILVNLAVSTLPATMTSLTGEKTDAYKVSDVSKKYLKTLDEQITVYIVQIDGADSEHDLMIKKYVERYATLSDKLTVKYIDPEIKPGFLPSYNKDNAISEESLGTSVTHLVVESGKRARIVPYSDIFKYALSDEEIRAIYQTYGYIPDSVPISYEIENCLLSAIDYVTLDVLPTIYYTNNHKENALDEYFTAFAKLENIGLSALDMDKEGKIPSDAQAVIIYAPESDFTEKEIDALKEYADRGGRIILSTEYNINLTELNFKNLYSFTSEYYGMSFIDAFVMEGDRDHVYSEPIYILTTMTDKVPSAVKTGQQGYVLFTYAHGIEVATALPEGVTVDTLFTTSGKGYAKPDFGKEDTLDKSDGDLSGTFVLGASSTRVSGETKSKLWWFSSTDAINTNMNPYLAIYVLTSSVDKRESVSAASVILTYDVVDISSKAADFWSWIIIAIVPGTILGYGIHVRVRRARR